MGDVQLDGRAVDVTDPELRRRYREAIRARIEWAPDEPGYHLFSLDVQAAPHVRFDEAGMDLWRWTPAGGLEHEVRPAV